MKKKVFQIRAQGSSMYPILQDGDTIEYAQTPFAQIQLNDIVLVYSHDILVTHRVIYKTKTTCITRGDNNKSADASVQKGRVLARVVRFRRGGRWHGIQDVYLAQSALYLHEIQKLETLLTLTKIPHVFLKGVLVSLRYENAIPQRIYADCDVLVNRMDEIKIEKVFEALGYKLHERAFPRPLRSRHRPTEKPEVSYVKIVRGVPVVFDVHFEPVFLMTQLGGMNMLYPSKLLASLGEKIINSGEKKKIKGFQYSICSPLHQILYLALHIFHHNFTDSMRYQLLDTVVRKSIMSLRANIDSAKQSALLSRLPRHSVLRNDMWDELARTINDYRLEGYTYGVFLLLKKYFHTPIPALFLTSICPSRFALYVSRFAIRHVDIFSQGSRTKAGIMRFLLIFLLSPNPLWKKLLLFIHPHTVGIAWKLGIAKLSSIIFFQKHLPNSAN